MILKYFRKIKHIPYKSYTMAVRRAMIYNSIFQINYIIKTKKLLTLLKNNFAIIYFFDSLILQKISKFLFYFIIFIKKKFTFKFFSFI